MREYAINNLWSPDGCPVEVPDNAVAVYSARWIDQGDDYTPDIVPDRQGFAYDEKTWYDALIRELDNWDARNAVHLAYLDRDDEAHRVIVSSTRSFQFWARRAGGYFYVKGWIT